ncbi:DUF1080 domain-containing protein [Candidatus Sumerlaeota bacterium]|nr:DUF1080 domain-containing protein [Candidatus Sumerlaeota bacterium]
MVRWSVRNVAGLYHGWLTALLAVAVLVPGGQLQAAVQTGDPNALLPGEANQGFVSLFNGRNLDGWVIDRCTTESFVVRDGIIECSGAGDFETILRTTDMFENFELRLEYMTGSWCESGVVIHVPPVGRATTMGTKVQIYHQVGVKPEPTIAGSIFGVITSPKDMAKPARQWNDMRILMDWPRLRVELNGEQLHDINVENYEALKYRERKGFVALQDLGSRIAFRRIRLRRLPDKDKWESLFNGRDFTGWHEADSAKWDVHDGAIRGFGSTGYMITDKKYKDFELKATVRTSPRANAGIFFRWNRETTKDKDRGYEIQIRNSLDSTHPTGSLYEVERAYDDQIATDGKWFVMHIIARGPHIISRVDGKTVSEVKDAKKVGPGHIALQMHMRNAWCEFKDIKIKDLSPEMQK